MLSWKNSANGALRNSWAPEENGSPHVCTTMLVGAFEPEFRLVDTAQKELKKHVTAAAFLRLMHAAHAVFVRRWRASVVYLGAFIGVVSATPACSMRYPQRRSGW